MSTRVRAPDGGEWDVRRRALLWRPRRRMHFDADPVGLLLGALALPLRALEWVAAAIASLAAAALRRPWRVEAVLPGATRRRLTWEVAGWRAAGDRAIRCGRRSPPERIRRDTPTGARSRPARSDRQLRDRRPRDRANELEAQLAVPARRESSPAWDAPIALISTDVTMPGLSGPELIERLQRSRPESRVLFISGYTAETVRGRGSLPLGSGFVGKPFDSITLLRTVRELLDQPSRQSERGSMPGAGPG